MKDNLQIIGGVVLLITNIVTVVVVITTIKNKLQFLGETFAAFVSTYNTQVTDFKLMHTAHYSHASNTGIHQESISRETLKLHFDTIDASIKGLASEFKTHSDNDMAVMKEMAVKLDQIKERLPQSSVA